MPAASARSSSVYGASTFCLVRAYLKATLISADLQSPSFVDNPISRFVIGNDEEIGIHQGRNQRFRPCENLRAEPTDKLQWSSATHTPSLIFDFNTVNACLRDPANSFFFLNDAFRHDKSRGPRKMTCSRLGRTLYDVKNRISRKLEIHLISGFS